ncbi:MAG: hypothetical protein N3B21_08920 [Clostridia bacterium]|nr:hypothetical protein [Clostridia bacterium]
MVKKICFMLVFVIIFTLCSFSAFAGSEGTVFDSDTKATKEKYFNITKPEEGKTVFTYSKSYTISGVTKVDNIVIELYRLNEEKKQYEKVTIEEKSSWLIEDSGINFAKEIDLKEGKNIIMLVASKGSDDKEPQRSIFEIKRDKQKWMDAIKNTLMDFFSDKK